MLFDRGLFQYEDKVCKYWPEFGQNGKEKIQILEVLQHESGLAWFSQSVPTIKNAWTENIKKNQIGKIIEKEIQKFPETSRHTEYHAGTRGLILNEIIRRLDPKVGYVQISVPDLLLGISIKGLKILRVPGNCSLEISEKFTGAIT